MCSSDLVGAAGGALAGHALGHLDLQGEVGVGGEREALDTQAGNVLDDLGVLEGLGVCAARGAVDGSCKRTSAVLVNLYDWQY